MKQVLWLASWYPNSLDKFDGDFIQRHANAVALYCKVHVIYVKKDEQLKTNEQAVEIQELGNLTEEIIYYNSTKTGVGFIDRALSHQKYLKYAKEAVTKYMTVNGKPDLLHVHVAMKAGLLGLWAKKRLGLPFIVTEHWTGYLPNADRQLQSFSSVYQKMIKKVLLNAAVVTVVSEYLGKSIQGLLPVIKYQVIPNVVDTLVFYPSTSQQASTKASFIHISNMNFQKNTEAILEALSLVKNEFAFEMNVYGTASPKIIKLVEKLGLQDYVFIKGEVTQPILAEAIRQSDALLLYSRFETFGCVIIEANACGVPVIVSDIEVLHEIVQEGINGTFVPGENANALAQKLKQFILQKDNFVPIEIAKQAAAKYNYKAIGRQFFHLYNNI